MCGEIFNYLMNLFSDCSKYQSEPEHKSKPEYKEIKVEQQNMYDQYRNNKPQDPSTQYRRMMSFFQVKNTTKRD